MTWSIRAGGSGDIDAVLAMWREGQALESVTDNPEGLSVLLTRDPGALVLAEAEGAVIGSIIAGWDGWRGQLYRLAVLPAWRRRGVASALVRAGEDRLVTLGARRIGATVVDGHDHAAAFWRSVGYVAEGQTRYVRTIG